MGCYVVDYVKGCDLCNHTKTYPVSPSRKLMPDQVPDHQWQVILVDLIMELQPSQGYNNGSSSSPVKESSHHTDHICVMA